MKKRNFVKIIVIAVILINTPIYYYLVMDSGDLTSYEKLINFVLALFVVSLSALSPYLIHRYYGRKNKHPEWIDKNNQNS